MDQPLSNEQLQALLEDTQASLAASFARVEAYRLQNRQLRDELSQLRTQIHGGGDGQTSAPATGGPDAASRQSSIQFPQQRNAGNGYNSLQNTAVYVSELAGAHPVSVINGGKKTPANLIISRDFIDVVESRARIYSHEFVGITSVKTPVLPSQRSSSGIFCCFSPTPDPALSYGAPGQDDGSSTSGRETGTWQFIWNKDKVAQRLVFEAGSETRHSLHRHTERWLGVEDHDEGGGQAEDAGHAVPPKPLVLGSLTLTLVGEPSQIFTSEHLKALASAVPPMERLRRWQLSYSTSKHGISLSTLYRRASEHAPTLLVIRDNSGYVFGCYTGEGWRVAPRFYGSGETFVFQVEPHRVMYPWRSMSQVKNDFFQYATLECLAVGGLGRFAIHLDSELLQGSSGTCGTFGSPCLAGSEEFKASQVEVWQALQ